MVNTYDAIIIGGGIVGSAIAYNLVLAGAKTLLIDREEPGRATDASAGILSPETGTNPLDTWFNFAVEAMSYYPTLIMQLQDQGTPETGYDRCGKMVVAIDDDELSHFMRVRKLIFDRQKKRDYPTAHDLYTMRMKEAKTKFPPLANPLRIIYYRHAARIDGRLLLHALRWAAEQKGLDILKASVEELALTNVNSLTDQIEGLPYERWFQFAEKSRNRNNEAADFEEFEGDEIFEEMMRRLNRGALTEEDEAYIESEQEMWEEVVRLEQSYYGRGHRDGWLDGRDVGFADGNKRKPLIQPVKC